MKRAASPLACALALALAACGGDESRGNLVIELAPSVQTGCAVDPEPLPSDATCVRVRVCEDLARPTTCVLLARPESDHRRAANIEIDLATESRRVVFDAQLARGKTYEVEVFLFSGGTSVLAKGTARRVTFGSGPVRVRVYRAGTVSCAGGLEGGGWPTPRAFHHAITLPNDDVLIFGGVTGDRVVADAASGGAALARTIEVYRPSEHRFLQVSGELRRVLSAAVLVAGNVEGPYTIRVAGGYTSQTDAAALRIDPLQFESNFRAPIIPGEMVTVADDVDLVYDPRALSVRVEADTEPLRPRGAYNDIAAFGDRGPAAVLVGSESFDASRSPLELMLSGRVYWLDRDGQSVPESRRTLVQPRLGATITRLHRDTDLALVFGGNVSQTSADAVLAAAGELTSPTADPRAVASDVVTGVPASTVFHSATEIRHPDGDAVILAGGLAVGAAGVTQPILTTFTTRPLVAMSESAGTVTGVDVGGLTFRASIFHAALRIPQAEPGNDWVVLSGGWTDDLRTLTASRQLGIVRASGGGFAFGPVHASIDIDGLGQPRFGHAMATLPESRILVTGGFTPTAEGTLRAVDVAEIIDYDVAPDLPACTPDAMPDGGAASADAGVRDAGRDAGGIEPDAGFSGDSGADDAGL